MESSGSSSFTKIKKAVASQRNQTTEGTERKPRLIDYLSSEPLKISKRTVIVNQDLLRILAQINTETVQQAYQKSLPPDAELWDLESQDLAVILTKLDEFRRLADFVAQLTQDTEISEELREKIKHYTENLLPKKTQEDKIENPKSPNSCPQQLESFVLFTLNSTENKDRFLLNAWLIKDNSVKDISKYKSLLDSNEQQLGIICKSSEITIKIGFFNKKALEELRKLRPRKSYLILEFFLPHDLMLSDIDRWKIPFPVVGEKTLGAKYPVRFRSLDRLNFGYLDAYWDLWCDRWKEVLAVLDDETALTNFEHLKEMESFNGILLEGNLISKIGLKITCSPTKSKIKELFNAILTATTPIAIWTRCEPSCEQLADINEFLLCKPLCDLCESLTKLRQTAAYIKDAENYFGSHLAILWEDPYRLTPDRMVELKVMGK